MRRRAAAGRRRAAGSRGSADVPLGPSGETSGYVFIVTYGRSGSTLLQGILGSIPGYLLRGENGDALHGLFRFHRTLTEASERQRNRLARKGVAATTPRDAWFGIEGYRPEDALERQRELVLGSVLRPERGTRVVGFKEIRWWHDDWEDYLAYLQELFPGARFVVNTRNLDDVARSKWWAEQPDARERLEGYERRLHEILRRLGPAAFHVSYDDYVRDVTTLRGLFEWLGEDLDEALVGSVIQQRHSY